MQTTKTRGTISLMEALCPVPGQLASLEETYRRLAHEDHVNRQMIIKEIRNGRPANELHVNWDFHIK